MELKDEFGRVTRFSGTLLVSESTENDERPQWIEADVWRTNGGAYVIREVVKYRVRHLDKNCKRFGLNLVPRKATEEDTFRCPRCNPGAVVTMGGWGVQDRSSVEVAESPGDLIHAMKDLEGRINDFKKYLLALVSEQDEDVHALWMVVDVA